MPGKSNKIDVLRHEAERLLGVMRANTRANRDATSESRAVIRDSMNLLRLRPDGSQDLAPPIRS